MHMIGLRTCLLSMLLVTQAYAQGALVWSSAVDLSAIGRDASETSLALSKNGSRATAVWARFDGSNYVVQSASATISGGTATWGSVSTLSVTGHNASVPKVALSEDGSDAIAVWEYADTTTVIQAALATISGNTASWATPTDISNATQPAFQPQVAMSSNGQYATAVWSRSNGSSYIVQTRSVLNHGAVTWGAVSDLSVAGRNGLDPHVALSEDGATAVAVWTRTNGTYVIIQSAAGTISGSTATWGSVSDLSANGQSSHSPRIAVSETGAIALASWIRPAGSYNVCQSASAVVSGTSASWSSAADLSAPTHSATEPALGLSDDGALATALWLGSDGSFNLVQSASATISGGVSTWSSVATLSASQRTAFTPDLGVSEDGLHAAAIWPSYDGSNRVIQIAEANISGSQASWGAATDLTATGQDANAPLVRLATDGSLGTAVWHRSNGANTIVQSVSGAPATPTPTPTPTPTSALQIVGTPKLQGNGSSSLKPPKIQSTSSNDDGSLSIQSCAKYPKVSPGSFYLVAKKTSAPAQSVGRKKITRSDRCLTFNVTTAGTYRLSLSWKRPHQSSLSSRKRSFDVE